MRGKEGESFQKRPSTRPVVGGAKERGVMGSVGLKGRPLGISRDTFLKCVWWVLGEREVYAK